MTVPPLLPDTADPESAPFFDAARRHQLVVRRCRDCAAGTFPPTVHCPHCGSWDTDWVEVEGRGRLHTWTTVFQQLHPSFEVPYTVVVVDVDDVAHVRMVGTLAGAPDLVVGLPMEVWFQDLDEGVVLPQWRPVDRDEPGRQR